MANYKNFKLCEVLVKKDFKDDIYVYNVDSISYCIESNSEVFIITGKHAGRTLKNILKTDGNVNVCVRIDEPNDIRRYIPTDNLDKMRSFLENNLIGRHYIYNPETHELTSYQDEYFIDYCDSNNDEIFNKEEKPKGINVIKQNFDFCSQNCSLPEIEQRIRKKIINQDETLRKALITVYGNQKIFASNLSNEKKCQLKKNILIFGSTGTGKTEIIRQINHEINVPITIEDATRYTVAGYVGSSIDDMIKNLVRNAGNDIAKAQRGIIVIDEIDKKRKSDNTSGITSEKVQQSLLKLIEGSVFNIEEKENSPKYYSFDSSFVTVILCGAFSDLLSDGKITQKTIGFCNELAKPSKSKDYQPEDFIKYGMIPELMGRISTISKTNDLLEDDIKRIIIESEISPLRLQQEFYMINNTTIEYTEDFIDTVAHKVVELKTGARGIKLVLGQYLDDVDFEVLSGNLSGIELTKDGLVRKRIKNQNQPEEQEFTN